MHVFMHTVFVRVCARANIDKWIMGVLVPFVQVICKQLADYVH